MHQTIFLCHFCIFTVEHFWKLKRFNSVAYKTFNEKKKSGYQDRQILCFNFSALFVSFFFFYSFSFSLSPTLYLSISFYLHLSICLDSPSKSEFRYSNRHYRLIEMQTAKKKRCDSIGLYHITVLKQLHARLCDIDCSKQKRDTFPTLKSVVGAGRIGTVRVSVCVACGSPTTHR